MFPFWWYIPLYFILPTFYWVIKATFKASSLLELDWTWGWKPRETQELPALQDGDIFELDFRISPLSPAMVVRWICLKGN